MLKSKVYISTILIILITNNILFSNFFDFERILNIKAFNINRLFDKNLLYIDFSGLLDFYKILSKDEQEEQIADFAGFSLLSLCDRNFEKKNAYLKKTFSIRLKALDNSSLLNFNYGRIIQITDDEFIALIPYKYPENDYILTGLLDETRKSETFLKKTIHEIYFDYTINSSTISLKYEKTGIIKDYFTTGKGYYEMIIRNYQDLNNFISLIDDITYFKQNQNGEIVLGGRRSEQKRKKNITIEDIAVLYKSYFSPLKKPDKNKKEKYEAYINYLLNELLEKNIEIKTNYSDGIINKSQIMTYIKNEVSYENFDLENRNNIGFSLDPEINLINFGNDLFRILQSSSGNNINISLYKDELEKVASDLKSGNRKKYLILKRKIKNNLSEQEQILNRILDSTEFNNSYQKARYDGPIKGSNIAMILFYTDLVAKIWALDYENSSPGQFIPGFIPLPVIKVPKFYWADLIRLSSTRLWFGVKEEAFDISEDKKIIYFAPIVTRIYAASSNPLYPGKETKPNFQSNKFISWWDNHYSKVADYEQEYYKLNQIQKWSIIFNFIRNNNKDPFIFLNNLNLDYSKNFEIWYRNNDTLKCKVNVPFLENKKDTEKLVKLTSKNYIMMGKSFFIYGGVSLASDKDLIIKTLGKKILKNTFDSTTVNNSSDLTQKKENLTGKNKKNFAKTKSPSSLSVQKNNIALKNSVKKQFSEKPVKINIFETPPGNKKSKLSTVLSQAEIEFSDLKFGLLSAKKDKNIIILDWTDNFGAIFQKYLDNLTEFENSLPLDKISNSIEKIIMSGGFIKSQICIEKNKKYFITIKNSKPIYAVLGINDEAKKEEYSIHSSGTEEFSNIYGLRTAKQFEIKKYASIH